MFIQKTIKTGSTVYQSERSSSSVTTLLQEGGGGFQGTDFSTFHPVPMLRVCKISFAELIITDIFDVLPVTS
jgi:hypothetical protein